MQVSDLVGRARTKIADAKEARRTFLVVPTDDDEVQVSSAVHEDSLAPQWLRLAAAWSWRLLVVTGAVVLVFMGARRVQVLIIALFIALILTSVLRPVADFLDRWIPRPLATIASFLLAFGMVGGLATYIGMSVSGQWEDLSRSFVTGLEDIRTWLDRVRLPFIPDGQSPTEWLQARIDDAVVWIQENTGEIATQVFTQLGSIVVIFTVLALALFSAFFFINSGADMWRWFLRQLPMRARASWTIAGSAAWDTFSGYSRGIFIVAATNGFFAGLALALLRVPLAAPLGLLVFVGTFIPLIGAPLAMGIAMIVALAANGPGTALLVGILIAVIGQLEGDILQPLVMGRAVSLHPVVVAFSVIAGTLLFGLVGAVLAVPLVSVSWTVFSTLRTRIHRTASDAAARALSTPSADSPATPTAPTAETAEEPELRAPVEPLNPLSD